MASIKNYYAGGNTSIGFYSLYDDVFRGLKRLFIIKGGPGTGKSSFMRTIGLNMLERGYDVELYHCSSDNNSLDGLIIPKLKLGIVDGTAPHLVDPKYPGAVDEIINFGQYWNTELLKKNAKHIIKITNEISDNFKTAYEQFAEAKIVHDEWEEIYLSAIDFEKANKVTEGIIAEIFNKNFLRDEIVTNKRVFFGAATPNGPVNYIDNITEDINKRYIIKGRPGSGKSTMMKKIGEYAKETGLSVEYYPCGFDPYSLDMIIIPTLSIAIIDGTAPHVIEPNRTNDEVIDMFKLCINTDIEKRKEKELSLIEQRYKIKMTIGTNYLKEAKRLHDILEEYYIKAMDFNGLDAIRMELLDIITQYSESD